MWHNTVEASVIGKKKISDIKQVHVKAFYTEESGKGRNGKHQAGCWGEDTIVRG